MAYLPFVWYNILKLPCQRFNSKFAAVHSKNTHSSYMMVKCAHAILSRYIQVFLPTKQNINRQKKYIMKYGCTSMWHMCWGFIPWEAVLFIYSSLIPQTLKSQKHTVYSGSVLMPRNYLKISGTRTMLLGPRWEMHYYLCKADILFSLCTVITHWGDDTWVLHTLGQGTAAHHNTDPWWSGLEMFVKLLKCASFQDSSHKL